tara:strand:+ start:4679 stop:4897 length:219 start_codon:yes stop_codon:yes gene_type:complete
MTIKKRKASIKPCRCGTTSKDQMDMILYEIRQNRKDILELKQFMNKSKGTVSVLVFLIGIIGTVYTAFSYFR